MSFKEFTPFLKNNVSEKPNILKDIKITFKGIILRKNIYCYFSIIIMN